jgi:hypothetical protein
VKRDERTALSHAHDVQGRWLHDAGFGKEIGSGVDRNRDHDNGLRKDVRVWVEQIERVGGSARVLSENDLKRSFGKLVNDAGSAKNKEAAAASLGLTVVNGTVQFPDARLEIVWRDGREEVRDLERLSPEYRPRTIAAKAKAGFFMSGPRTGKMAKDGPDVVTSLAES